MYSTLSWHTGNGTSLSLPTDAELNWVVVFCTCLHDSQSLTSNWLTATVFTAGKRQADPFSSSWIWKFSQPLTGSSPVYLRNVTRLQMTNNYLYLTKKGQKGLGCFILMSHSMSRPQLYLISCMSQRMACQHWSARRKETAAASQKEASRCFWSWMSHDPLPWWQHTQFRSSTTGKARRHSQWDFTSQRWEGQENVGSGCILFIDHAAQRRLHSSWHWLLHFCNRSAVRMCCQTAWDKRFNCMTPVHVRRALSKGPFMLPLHMLEQPFFKKLNHFLLRVSLELRIR